jgi:uncharacterized protein YkwD
MPSDQTFLGSMACADVGDPVGGPHRDMFVLVNEYRAANGLGALVYSLTLQQAADDFAEQLYREDFFDHTAPDGSEPDDRAVAAGFCHPFVGENIGYGLNQLGTAAQALEGFQASPGHNANLLRPEWAFVGIGVYHVMGPQGSEYWWVQLFARDIEWPE